MMRYGVVAILISALIIACEAAIPETSVPTTATPPAPATVFEESTEVPTPIERLAPTPIATPIPPSASFSVDVESGKAPVMVEFLNTSTGTTSSVEWDFGDGTTSTDESPVHRYTIAGTYTVRLTVSGPGGTDTSVSSNLVTVTAGQPASLEVTPSIVSVQVQQDAEYKSLVRDEFGNIFTDKVNWSITSGGGSIDSNGVFTAGTLAGTFDGTVRVSFLTESVELTELASAVVKPGPLAQVTVEPSQITLDIGSPQTLRVKLLDEFANELFALISWTLGPEVGTVDRDGVFIAGTKSGTFPTGIRLDAVEGTHRASASVDVTISPSPLASIEVQPATPTVQSGETIQLTATGYDEHGNPIPELEFLWESEEGIQVNQGGLVTAGDSEGLLYEVKVQASYRDRQQTRLVTIAVPPVWVPVEDMTGPRLAHTATLLTDGRVLIVGGNSSFQETELYDPAARKFSRSGRLLEGRAGHTATLLPDGKVLIVGGWCVASAELYNPATGTFTSTGNLGQARVNHTATLLSTGKVLIVGGGRCKGGTFNTAEVYDPEKGIFTPSAGNLVSPRRRHRAALLHSGRVLITGGFNWPEGSSTVVRQWARVAELYDPGTDTFLQTGKLIQGSRANDPEASTPLLPDGQLLLTSLSGRIELYDPEKEVFTQGGIWKSTWGVSVTLLPNGLVLIAGGGGAPTLDRADLYDPARHVIIATTTMTNRRVDQRATLLLTGEVLVTGGKARGAADGERTIPLDSAELFIP